jgi:hypothetical protein
MKLMLPLPPYHIIYLIIKLSWINFMLIRLEDYSISIEPFIATPFNYFMNLKHPCYPLNTKTRPMFCWTLWILVFVSNSNLLKISYP